MPALLWISPLKGPLHYDMPRTKEWVIFLAFMWYGDQSAGKIKETFSVLGNKLCISSGCDDSVQNVCRDTSFLKNSCVWKQTCGMDGAWAEAWKLPKI